MVITLDQHKTKFYDGLVKATNIGEAKTQFSALIHEVEAGETVVIARDGTPVAKIVRVDTGGRRKLGTDAGLGWIADDFDEPMPDELLRTFYGGTLPQAKT